MEDSAIIVALQAQLDKVTHSLHMGKRVFLMSEADQRVG
jgi:hypothetical protein